MSPQDPSQEPAPAKGKRRFLPMVKLTEWEHDILPEPHECTSARRASFMFKIAVGTLLLIGLISYHGISGNPDDDMQSWWLGAPLLFLWTIIILEGLLGMAMARPPLGRLQTLPPDRPLSSYSCRILDCLS